MDSKYDYAEPRTTILDYAFMAGIVIMMVLMPETYSHDEGYRIAVTKAKTSYLDFKAV